MRAKDGTFSIFDPPGQIAAFAPFTFAQTLYINPDGVITGAYFEPISGNPFAGNYRVFVRNLDGTFTTFDAATYPPCCIWSFPSGITPADAITGSFNDGFTINHGFLRARDGTVTTFDVPGAGTGFNQGTAPLCINPAGVIMGLYIDTNIWASRLSLAAAALMLRLPSRTARMRSTSPRSAPFSVNHGRSRTEVTFKAIPFSALLFSTLKLSPSVAQGCHNDHGGSRNQPPSASPMIVAVGGECCGQKANQSRPLFMIGLR